MLSNKAVAPTETPPASDKNPLTSEMPVKKTWTSSILEDLAEDEEEDNLLAQALQLSVTLQNPESKEEKDSSTHIFVKHGIEEHFERQITATIGKDNSMNHCGVEVFGANRTQMLDTITVCLVNPAREEDSKKIRETLAQEIIDNIIRSDDLDRREDSMSFAPGIISFVKTQQKLINDFTLQGNSAAAATKENNLHLFISRQPEVIFSYLQFVYTHKIGGVIDPKLSVTDLKSYAIAEGINLVIYKESGKTLNGKKCMFEVDSYHSEKNNENIYVVLGERNDHFEKLILKRRIVAAQQTPAPEVIKPTAEGTLAGAPISSALLECKQTLFQATPQPGQEIASTIKERAPGGPQTS